jgi:hypothetical protein
MLSPASAPCMYMIILYSLEGLTGRRMKLELGSLASQYLVGGIPYPASVS